MAYKLTPRKNDQNCKINLELFITRTGMSNFDPEHTDLIQNLHKRCKPSMICEALWIAQNMTTLQEAVIHHSLMEMKKLLIEGVDINALDWSGITPLSTAVICNFQNGINVLLNSGACIDIYDHWGLTALHYAIICQNLQLTDYLITKGADINIKSLGRAETILNWTARNNLTVRVNFLLGKGADPNIESNDGFTPLFYACRHENIRMAESIIRNGADVNHKSNDGWTAMHFAAKASSVEVVRLLLLSGADPNARTVRGITPLRNADPGLPLMFRLTPVVETLLMGGASLSCPYNSSLTIAEYYQSCLIVGAVKFYSVVLETANLKHMCEFVKDVECCISNFDIRIITHSERCKIELARMKKTRFGSASLHTVLTSLNNRNIEFVKNPELASFIDSPSLWRRFPIYSTLIKEALGRAQIREKLKDIIIPKLINYYELGHLFSTLPNEVISYIVSYLEDKDLRNLVKSFDL